MAEQSDADLHAEWERRFAVWHAAVTPRPDGTDVANLMRYFNDPTDPDRVRDAKYWNDEVAGYPEPSRLRHLMYCQQYNEMACTGAVGTLVPVDIANMLSGDWIHLSSLLVGRTLEDSQLGRYDLYARQAQTEIRYIQRKFQPPYEEIDDVYSKVQWDKVARVELCTHVEPTELVNLIGSYLAAGVEIKEG